MRFHVLAGLAALFFGLTLTAKAQTADGPALLAQGDAYLARASGPADYEAAYTAYLDAADAGMAIGYARAGRMKETGQVTSGNRADDTFESAMLYTMGAEAGCHTCMLEAARMYETAPEGVQRSLADALVWYSKAYELSFTKSDAEFANIRRVSSAGYDMAVAYMQAGEHWDAYQQFKTLCDFKGPGACYWLGMYQGAGNSPYGKDVPASLAPLAFACDHNVPDACRVHADLTGFVGPKAGYSNGYRAERFFKSLCDAATPNYSACFNVAWLNYYTDYGLNNWTTIQTYAGKSCWEGGHGGGCDLAFKMAQMMGPPPGSVPTDSGGNWGKSVDNAIGGIFAALLSGSEAYAATGSVGSSGSYSSGNAGRSTGNVAAWQDNRDWNEARRATANIGTAYSSSCRPGNSYC
jgi:hypothetical protein